MADARKVWKWAEWEWGRDSDLPPEEVGKCCCEGKRSERNEARCESKTEKKWKDEKERGQVLVFCSMARVSVNWTVVWVCDRKGYLHIRRRWCGSVKGGSESSIGSTRRVPLITSSWSPYVNSLSKSSEVAPAKAGPPLVWVPEPSVLTVMSP